MRNVHRKTGDGVNLTVHLQRNTGVTVKVHRGITVNIQTDTDGSLLVYNDSGQPFVVETLLPSKLAIAERA